MAELENRAVEGKQIVWLYRLESDRLAGESATGMALETNAELTKSRDAETLVTKRRTYRMPAGFDYTGSATTYYGTNDPMVDKMDDAIDNGELVEFWLIETAVANEDGKFKSEYYTGYITSLSKTSGAEGAVEVSLEYALEAPGAKGYATLTEEQQEVARTVFVDTVPVA